MNDLEERLRTVTRAAAEQITAERIPPAPAPGRLRRAAPGLSRLAGGHSPRWRSRLAPAAAAVAVLGLAAGSLSLAHAIGGDQAGPAASNAGPPPYYVALADSKASGAAQPGNVVVRSTATGAVITHAPRPAGEEYVGVSGASDDSTFVLSAETTYQINHTPHDPSAPARFYLLRFDPATHTAKLTPLPVPELPRVTWFALSPDATELAVFSTTGETLTVSVYSVASGAARTWTLALQHSGYVWVPQATAHWVQGGRLAFWLGSDDGNRNLLGLLNTTTPGGSLLASSRTFPKFCGVDAITMNGALVFGPSWLPRPTRLQECTLARGSLHPMLPRTLRCQGGPVASYLGVSWVSPTGRTLIVDVECRNTQSVVGVVSAAGGVVRRLPGSSPIPSWSAFPGSPISW